MTSETISPKQKQKALWLRRAADGFSIARAVGGPLMGRYIANNPNFRRTSTACILAALAATDYVDGKLAKKAHALDPEQKKPHGAWLDQMADKVFVHGIMGGLALRSHRNDDRAGAAFFAVNGAIQFGRDMLVTNIRKQAAEHSINTSARQLGRLKTFVTLTALTARMIPELDHNHGRNQDIATLSGIAAGTGLAIISGATLAHELQHKIKEDVPTAVLPEIQEPV